MFKFSLCRCVIILAISKPLWKSPQCLHSMYSHVLPLMCLFGPPISSSFSATLITHYGLISQCIKYQLVLCSPVQLLSSSIVWLVSPLSVPVILIPFHSNPDVPSVWPLKVLQFWFLYFCLFDNKPLAIPPVAVSGSFIHRVVHRQKQRSW